MAVLLENWVFEWERATHIHESEPSSWDKHLWHMRSWKPWLLCSLQRERGECQIMTVGILAGENIFQRNLCWLIIEEEISEMTHLKIKRILKVFVHLSWQPKNELNNMCTTLYFTVRDSQSNVLAEWLKSTYLTKKTEDTVGPGKAKIGFFAPFW